MDKINGKARNSNSFNFITNYHVRWFDPEPEIFGRRYLPFSNSLVKPQYEDFVTPLVPENYTRDDVISEFENFIGNKFNVMNSTLQKIEIEEKNKVGPYSVKLSLSERKQNITPYFFNRNFSPIEEIFTEAVLNISKRFPKNTLRPVGLDLVYEEADKSTNWGAPTCGKGTDDGLEHLRLAKDYLTNPRRVTDPCFLGWRGQPSGEDIPKQRVVWMYPHYIVLIEVAFLKPLLSIFRQWDEYAMADSFDSIEKVLTKFINISVSNDIPLIGVDFSQYDASVCSQLIKSAFYIIKGAYQRQYHDVLDMICVYMCESTLLAGDVKYRGRDGGIPSGSGLTNLVDTIVHLIIFEYARLYHGISSEESNCTLMGDDGVYILPGVSPVDLSFTLGSLGMKMSPYKCTYAIGYTVFCQRLYHADYKDHIGIVRGVRSMIRCLNSMMSFERRGDHEDPFFNTCRWITQLENSKNHPLFYELVEFCIGLDNELSLGAYTKGGPIEIFRSFGKGVILEKLGKGFRYTSEVREEDDFDNLKTIEIIKRISSKHSL